MLGLIIVSVIIGLVVSGFSSIGILGLIVGVFFFVCGLPFALIGSFVHGEVSYAQDRADYRQFLSEYSADMRSFEHELAEDMRTDRLVESEKPSVTQVYNDHRQIHLYGGKDGN